MQVEPGSEASLQTGVTCITASQTAFRDLQMPSNVKYNGKNKVPVGATTRGKEVARQNFLKVIMSCGSLPIYINTHSTRPATPQKIFLELRPGRTAQ